jgi:hypothetical protein
MMPERVTGSRGTVHGRKVVEANKAHLTSAWERERTSGTGCEREIESLNYRERDKNTIADGTRPMMGPEYEQTSLARGLS